MQSGSENPDDPAGRVLRLAERIERMDGTEDSGVVLADLADARACAEDQELTRLPMQADQDACSSCVREHHVPAPASA